MRGNHPTAATIQLNDTFIRLVTGKATIGDIMAERKAASAAELASLDDCSRRHRKWAERCDPFGLNFCF